MGFFDGFSRRPGADSERLQKRLVRSRFLLREFGFFSCGRWGNAAERGRKMADLFGKPVPTFPDHALVSESEVSLTSSADPLQLWRAHGLADVVLAFRSIPAGY